MSLQLLLLEDNPLDAELILETLKDGGIDCLAERVQTREAFRAALEQSCYGLILADYSLPQFDGAEALRYARERCPDIPFIFVSGALGEELAIETLKQGATDYVLKHRLERLVPAVYRALREADERAARQRLEDALRQRMEELAEANRRKTEFLAVLAHELRNPLAPIFSSLEVLAVAPTEEAAARARAVVERQVRHMAHLLDDLLDVSRISRGKILLRRQPVDLARLVRETAEDHRRPLEEAGVTLEAAVPPEAVWVSGDATRLAQVAGNLLSNAAKFTPSGGRVQVRLECVPGREEVVLTVRDTGVGIEPAVLARLFEPFAQGEVSSERGGLGLGLAMVRGLVELHGGSVSVFSAGRNRGAEFRIALPLASPDAVPTEAAAPPINGAAPAPAGRRVLVIDDNRDAADTLRDLLELSRHQVEVAYTGPDGLEIARRFRPDVVLCDLGLPGMDGYTVASRLREDAATAAAHLIAVTGYGQEEDRRRTREAGFDLHLTKPVDPSRLRELLEEPGTRGPAV